MSATKAKKETPKKNKNVQIVKEEESYGAPPLDFSFKSLKDLRDILYEEPRKGQRKPIVEEEKKDDKNKEQKGVEDTKKNEEKEVTEQEEQQLTTTEGEKKTETEKNEEEGDKPKEKEEAPKQAPDKINIIPEAHIQNLLASHNHTLHTIAKAPGLKAADDTKVQETKQIKVNLICVSLILSYNEFRSLDGMYDIINKVMFNCKRLSWIDLSHNYLVALTKEFQNFPELRTLNIHCNYIHDLKELEVLQPLQNLKALTVHGNPVDLIPSFRLYIIGILPQLQKLDTVLITKKEKDNAHVLRDTFNLKKYPKLNPKEITKPPEPVQKSQNDQTE